MITLHGGLAQPVSLDPLEVATRLCDVGARNGFSILSQMKKNRFLRTQHPFQFLNHNVNVLVICNRHEKAKMHSVILSLQILRQRFEDVEFRQSRIRSVPGLGWVLQVRDVEAVEFSGGRELAGQLSQPDSVTCVSNKYHFEL